MRSSTPWLPIALPTYSYLTGLAFIKQRQRHTDAADSFGEARKGVSLASPRISHAHDECLVPCRPAIEHLLIPTLLSKISDSTPHVRLILSDRRH